MNKMDVTLAGVCIYNILLQEYNLTIKNSTKKISAVLGTIKKELYVAWAIYNSFCVFFMGCSLSSDLYSKN